MPRDKDRLFQAEVVLPVQFFDSARKQALRHTGECQLLAAVLTEAIECYQKNFGSSDCRKQKLCKEAEDWIMRKGDGFLFGFEHICGVLGIDPTYLRQGLMRWRAGRTATPCTAAPDSVPARTNAPPEPRHCADTPQPSATA
jgi:hypothetical protein